MPRRPKKPCKHPGCPELTDGDFCEEHAVLHRADRADASGRGYDSRWRKARKLFLKRHPLCEKCREQGKLTPAQEVHHILPLSRGGTHDETNLMALCKPCHSEITARDGDRWHSKK